MALKTSNKNRKRPEPELGDYLPVGAEEYTPSPTTEPARDNRVHVPRKTLGLKEFKVVTIVVFVGIIVLLVL